MDEAEPSHPSDEGERDAVGAGRRPGFPTDQKVGGSSPSERAAKVQVSGVNELVVESTKPTPREAVARRHRKRPAQGPEMHPIWNNEKANICPAAIANRWHGAGRADPTLS